MRCSENTSFTVVPGHLALVVQVVCVTRRRSVPLLKKDSRRHPGMIQKRTKKVLFLSSFLARPQVGVCHDRSRGHTCHTVLDTISMDISLFSTCNLRKIQQRTTISTVLVAYIISSSCFFGIITLIINKNEAMVSELIH